MIYILHGQDSKSSYLKFDLLTKNYPDFQKVNFSARDSSRDQFINALSAQNLFAERELIIGQNLIKNKIVNGADLTDVAGDTEIILWEDSQLSNMQLSKFKTIAKIELFKLPTLLYSFLDSIVPANYKTFSILQKLKAEGEENLIWQLSNRFFLLILAKNNTTFQDAQEIAGKMNKSHIADWQWQKITNQAYAFELSTLKALFAGTVKIDFMLKTATTNLEANTLISMLLLKYLKPAKNATIAGSAYGRYSPL